VAVTGYVADPRPFIQASVALLAPLRSGGGMRVKIVGAMQWGLPVVSTSIGCEGIQARPREDLLIADTPDHFAVETVRLLREPGLRERLSSAGRRLVERQYDWRQQYSLLDSIYARGSHG
jgi:glycosyltransferase involved in cell wall biosynthesis